MEADSILNMVEDSFCHHYFIISVIVSENESTVRAVLKHPSIGARGQVLSSHKGKLDGKIPVPSFLAYPSHGMNYVANNTFAAVSDSKSPQYGCTKSDALQLNKSQGYMINNNRNKSLDKLREASKVPLEHMFKNHEHCSTASCFKIRASVEVKEQNDKDNELYCKKNDTQMYNILKRLFFHFKQTKF